MKILWSSVWGFWIVVPAGDFYFSGCLAAPFPQGLYSCLPSSQLSNRGCSDLQSAFALTHSGLHSGPRCRTLLLFAREANPSLQLQCHWGRADKNHCIVLPRIPKDCVLGRSSWRYLLPTSRATKIKEPWKPLPKAQIEACFHSALFWRQLNGVLKNFLLFTILGDEERGQSVKCTLELPIVPFIFFILLFCCLFCGKSFLELELSYYFLRVQSGPLKLSQCS